MENTYAVQIVRALKEIAEELRHLRAEIHSLKIRLSR